VSVITEVSRPYVQHIPAADPVTRVRLDTVAGILLATAQELAIRLPPGEAKTATLQHLLVVLGLAREAISPGVTDGLMESVGSA
jgi:hypothetical protein